MIGRVIERATAAFGALALAVVIFLIWYWGVFDREPPLRLISQAETFVDFKGAPLPQVTAGSWVYIQQSYCHDAQDGPAEQRQNGRGFPATIHTRVINGMPERLPSISNVGVSGCFEEKRFRVQIPDHLRGEVKWLYSIEYFRNPLQVAIGGVEVEFPPITATVIPKEPG